MVVSSPQKNQVRKWESPMTVSSDSTPYSFSLMPTPVNSTSCIFLGITHFLVISLVPSQSRSLSLLAKITAIDLFPPSDLLLSEPFFTHQQNKSLDHNSHNSLLLTAPQRLFKAQRAMKILSKRRQRLPRVWPHFLLGLVSWSSSFQTYSCHTFSVSLLCDTLSPVSFQCSMSSVGPHPHTFLFGQFLTILQLTLHI